MPLLDWIWHILQGLSIWCKRHVHLKLRLIRDELFWDYWGKQLLHAAALGDRGAGREFIFILYLRRLEEKQNQKMLIIPTYININSKEESLPLLKLCRGDEGSAKVAVTNFLGLPPGGILLADDLKNVSSLKRKSSLLTRCCFVLKWRVVKHSPKIDLCWH